MSPPAWGWPAILGAPTPLAADVPTRVGMARTDDTISGYTERCPHPRGDGPLGLGGVAGLEVDVPTRVGMARFAATCRQE